MTTTVTKVDKKWEAKKIQETSTSMFAHVFVAVEHVLSKVDSKVREEYETMIRQHKINHFKTLGVKTPIDLVRAIAETEHNLFGSEIEISGDEHKATLKYNSCGMWNQMQKVAKFTPEQEKAMGEHCTESWTKIAKEFGFKFEPKMTDNSYEMTFSK